MNDDRAMSVEALLAGLQDIRLPASAPGGLLAEIAAVLALTCLAALAVSALLRLVSRRGTGEAAPSLRADLRRVAQLPETERRVALLHLLKCHAPDRFAELRAALYRPGGGPDADSLTAELERHV